MTVLGALNGLGEEIGWFDHLGRNMPCDGEGFLRLHSEDRLLFRPIGSAVLFIHFYLHLFLSTYFEFFTWSIGKRIIYRSIFPC